LNDENSSLRPRWNGAVPSRSHETDAKLRERLSPDRCGLVVVAADGPNQHESALDEAAGQRQQGTHVTDADG
jgi:hypothetical protein